MGTELGDVPMLGDVPGLGDVPMLELLLFGIVTGAEDETS